MVSSDRSAARGIRLYFDAESPQLNAIIRDDAMNHIRRLAALCFGLAFAAASAAGAVAADKIRIGKSVNNPLAFAPVDIGLEKGIWAQHGLDITSIDFAGDAKLQQAFVARAVDFGLGSGPAIGFLAKGVPAKAVGVIANQPLSMGLTVSRASMIKTAGDLKGARIAISTAGSLTYWLARELSRRLGWGSDGIRTVPLGAVSAELAALKRNQVDGFVASSSQGLMLEKANEGRLLLEFGNYIKDFHTHVIIASNDMTENKPDQVRRFLAAWKEIIAFMFANKAETVRIAQKVTGLDDDIQSREYDHVMPMMSRDLRFSAKALDAIGNSFPELDILPAKPDMSALVTERFLDESR
jgi:NitT/TauT family transport system substrate-binding protein